MAKTDEDLESRWETDIDIVSADSVLDNGSVQSRADFEIAFFTVILTIVLAYPSETAEYAVIKGLLVLFAVLMVLRRVVVTTEYRSDTTRFMVYSKELIVELSTLGVLYGVIVLSEAVSNVLWPSDSLLVFGIACLVLGLIPNLLFSLYARDDLRLDMVIIASRWANQSPIQYWRRYHRNQAIKKAKNIDQSDEELPEEILELREKTVRRTLPFPSETAQFLHGLSIRLARWATGAIFGWIIFQRPIVSLTLLISITLIGSQIHLLYRRYGVEGYKERPNRKTRALIQSLTIFIAHPLLLI